jgi:hypothetical protein
MTDTEYIVDAFFKSFDALIIKNRAYHAALFRLAKGDPDVFASYMDEVKKAIPSVVEPPVFIDLRKQAIEAVESRKFEEFDSLARSISQRVTAWL